MTDCERSSPQLPRLGYSPGLPCQGRKFCSSVEFPIRTLPYPPQYWFSAVARKNGAGIAFVSSPFPHLHTVTRVRHLRSEENTSELQSLMRISYAVFCLKKKKQTNKHQQIHHIKHHLNKTK